MPVEERGRLDGGWHCDEHAGVRSEPVTTGWWLVAAAALALAVAVPGQDAPFAEMRRWRWRTPPIPCVAGASTDLVAYAVAVPGSERWELVTYDPAARRETARIPSPWRPVGLRWGAPGHLDVRVRDRDGWLSWFHWHTVRLADGAVVGEPVNYRIADDEPKPGGAEWATMAGPNLMWSRPGECHAITDGQVHDLVLTPDGQFVVLWLPTRVVAVPVGAGEARVLPVASEQVRAITAGADGDEVLVLGANKVDVFRCGGGPARRVELPVHEPWHAALQPGGSLLAVAAGAQADTVLVDMVRGGSVALGRGYARVAWAADGQTVIGGTLQSTTCWNADGGELWTRGEPWDRKQLQRVWSGASRYTVLPLPGGRVLESRNGFTWERSHEPGHGVGAGREPVFDQQFELRVGHEVVGVLGPDELLARDGAGLGLCDTATCQWRSTQDLGGTIGAIALRGRRVAAIVGDEVVVLDLRTVR